MMIWLAAIALGFWGRDWVFVWPGRILVVIVGVIVCLIAVLILLEERIDPALRGRRFRKNPNLRVRRCFADGCDMQIEVDLSKVRHEDGFDIFYCDKHAYHLDDEDLIQHDLDCARRERSKPRICRMG
jgi:hypothetical protein